ncbi:DEAD/DEAH box helicase [Herbaspirillum huttiense]|uniref:DEAD/DEAH box helicase n=1 Tax=Herbaspirillum huttiense TaxID=863372 RepID=UPI002E77595E|nr:DEAD/DEAH box helicase family protein [Herbaspirillum huttiense]MEE1636917.1 DEAD/DEAH box helicase family protein [Herbaspirillum huttiense NC40101]
MNMSDTTTTSMPKIQPKFQVALDLPVQASTHQPERFQAELMDNISKALLRTPAPPCLLRAPTGSGKTFVMGQVLQRIGAQRDVLWFWFVPFVTLVGQTLDSLLHHAPDLSPVLFSQGRNQDVGAGTVLISTAQGVARAQWRTKGYDADADDDVRTLAALVARARAKGLQIGLVVDEAHIGLDKSTEFGKFAHWLQADYLLMATATPKDQRLTDFVAHAGYSGQEHFSVSRDDVVKARLNKQYIEAVVYSLGTTMQQVTDLRRTVLRQAWARNVLIGHRLQQAGIACTPLLLVQVANGERAVEEAAEELMRQCNVPPEAIGKHSADEPDPVLMAAIANDTTKQVLIFKQSAGTGFDAPRAFVLASTKPVNDTDFAMQFIGRVMRVARQVRDSFPKPQHIPAELNTAYVYLGNAQAQAGFEAAVQATSAVKSQLEGQTEKLLIRHTIAGGLVYTNRPTAEQPLSYSMGLPGTQVTAPASASDSAAPSPSWLPPASSGTQQTWGQDLFGDPTWALDTQATEPAQKKSSRIDKPSTRAEVLEALTENRLRTFHRRENVPTLNAALKSEEKPSLVDLSAISLQVAQSLEISSTLAQTAVNAALNRVLQKELHRELTEGTNYAEDILVVTDRAALAREAMNALQELPHAEEEDYRIIVQTISARLRRTLDLTLEAAPSQVALSEKDLFRMSRDAAHWVIRDCAQELREAIFQSIADQAKQVDAQPLPNVMIFPEDLPLETSRKNIYGVLPPSTELADAVETVLFMDERNWWTDRIFTLEDGSIFSVGRYDGWVKLNNLEQAFARALDDADFVHWWHRNPDKKPYSVRVVRAEHDHYFYPDFVVCISHSPGEAPMQRLLETKESTKDASRKSQHFPTAYGKVLFLTPDGNRLRWVNENGSLGEVLKLSELQAIQIKLKASQYTCQPV